MQIQLVTWHSSCLELIQKLLPINGHTIDIRFLKPYDLQNFNFERNDFNCDSWIYFGSYENFRHSTTQYIEPLFRHKIFCLKKFIMDNSSVASYSHLWKMHYGKPEPDTWSVNDEEEYYQKMGVTKQAYFTSLGFRYKEEKDKYVVDDNHVKAAFEKLKALAKGLFNKGITHLYLTPNLDPNMIDIENAWKMSEYYPETNYEPDFYNTNSWEELGKEEEKRMNDETDGFWRNDME